jgi:hypothetical protein
MCDLGLVWAAGSCGAGSECVASCPGAAIKDTSPAGADDAYVCARA